MPFSLLNHFLAEPVERLLQDERIAQGMADDERALSKEEALGIIHATLWAKPGTDE